MKKIRLLVLFTLMLSEVVWGIPGKLLIIGGGSEESGNSGWNAEAYSWAVNQSDNKRVAVISFSNSSTWLPEHFVSDWGAADSRLFLIGSEQVANDQATYDSLMQYDVIFLKGGDQFDYYSAYNDTKTEQAIMDKFNEGGVIAGTSAGLAVLGGVDFTAANGTVYAYECMENWDNQYIALADDFLPFLEGFIFDSHFVQRGRFPRLLAFLANWQTNNGEALTGIGVDDKTALAIQDNLTATAYGSGCVSIYHAKDTNVLNQSGETLLIDSVDVHQLIHGKSIDLNSFLVSGFSQEVTPASNQESGNYTIYGSGGSNAIAANETLLNQFVNDSGSPEDSVLILTNNLQDTAKLYEDRLAELGASHINVFPATSVYSDNVALTDAIQSARKILFVKADWNDLKAFLSSSNGKLFWNKIREPGMISAFVSDNSRFAGHTVVLNYDDPNASYDGLYGFDRGLDLLTTSVIIPKTYDPLFDAQYSQYENTVAAIPNAMIEDTLKYGIWLTRNNFFRYQPESGKAMLRPYGQWPVMVLKNEGTKGEFVSRGVGSESTEVRMLAGFQRLELSVIDSTRHFNMGDVSETPTSSSLHEQESGVTVKYDPRLNQLEIHWPNQYYRCELISTGGRKLLSRSDLSGFSVIHTGHLSSSVYIVRLETLHGNNNTKKLFVN